jgi:hypothetical protein
LLNLGPPTPAAPARRKSRRPARAARPGAAAPPCTGQTARTRRRGRGESGRARRSRRSGRPGAACFFGGDFGGVWSVVVGVFAIVRLRVWLFVVFVLCACGWLLFCFVCKWVGVFVYWCEWSEFRCAAGHCQRCAKGWLSFARLVVFEVASSRTSQIPFSTHFSQFSRDLLRNSRFSRACSRSLRGIGAKTGFRDGFLGWKKKKKKKKSSKRQIFKKWKQKKKKKKTTTNVHPRHELGRRIGGANPGPVKQFWQREIFQFVSF